MAQTLAPSLEDSRKDPVTGVFVSNPLVLYHAPCPDGFGAALSAWRYFEGKGEYLGIPNGGVPPDVTGRDVYLLDIAFDLEVMLRLDAQAKHLVVIDHHESTQAKLKAFGCRCGHVQFDLTKSAAHLAWRHFFGNAPLPALFAHVEDRDLLRWALEDSAQYLLALDAGPFHFARWNGILNMPAQKQEAFLERGRAIHQFYKKQVDHMCTLAGPVRLNGIEGLQANAPYVFHTDVGMALAQRSQTFGAAWCLEQHEDSFRVRVGLRAVGDFNTLPIAESFGGGGHANSSAFRLPLSSLPDFLKGELHAPAKQERHR